MVQSQRYKFFANKQPIVTLSSIKAEYVAATSGDCQAIWMRRILAESKMGQKDATMIYCYNNSVIKPSKNPLSNTFAFDYVLCMNSLGRHYKAEFLQN